MNKTEKKRTFSKGIIYHARPVLGALGIISLFSISFIALQIDSIFLAWWNFTLGSLVVLMISYHYFNCHGNKNRLATPCSRDVNISAREGYKPRDTHSKQEEEHNVS
jgi:hypothetical protein